MKIFACVGKKLQHLCSASCHQLTCFTKSIFFLFACICRFFLRRANPLFVQIIYFMSISTLGFVFLKLLKTRTEPSFNPRNLDLFFTSVSSTTVSSMSTVEMEVFSNPQLIVITILMLVRGEVFTSMVGLHFIRSRLKTELDKIAASHSKLSTPNPIIVLDQIELGFVSKSKLDAYNNNKPEDPDHHDEVLSGHDDDETIFHESLSSTNENLRYLSMKYLGFVVLSYFVIVHIIGIIGALTYLTIISSAKEVLRNKSLNRFTFSVFTIVSTFASCGFVPTNENMVVFGKNSGLLLMLIPQVLLGNTLYPPCLRFSIWVLGKLNHKKRETEYLLKKTEEVGYKHLLPKKYSVFLVGSVLGFILVQVIVFCALDWDSQGLVGMNGYEKFVGVLFQSVNSRHTGETIVDISILSPAILVLFVVMMYLPPYTSFLPLKDDGHDCESSDKNTNAKIMHNFIFSQLSYLVFFIILICIIERKKLKEDPLNFNVFNIVIEVISAYGNVGFSTGYSCKRQLNPEPNCEDKWFGFVGKWSDEGKMILILVMIFGRLKKFNMNGGKPWKLL